MYCPKCGCDLKEGETECPHCHPPRASRSAKYPRPVPVKIPKKTARLRILVLVLFVIVGIPVALLGGMFTLYAITPTKGIYHLDWLPGGLAYLGIFAGLLYWVVFTYRKK